MRPDFPLTANFRS